MALHPHAIGALIENPNLDTIFHPDSIAVVGASEKRGSIGRAVMTNLIDGGFDGHLFAVNPTHDRLFDRQAFARVADPPDVPDLAIIAIPIVAPISE